MLIDLISIIILVACFCLGYKKGLIKSVMGLVSLVAAIVLAINFYAYPAAYLKDNLIQPYFVDDTSETFSALMNGGTEIIPPEKIFEDEPDALWETAEKYGLDVDTIRQYYESAVKGVVDSFDINGISEKLSEFVVGSTVDTISNVLGFAAIFFASLIIINLVLRLINLLFKLPVLNFANKLAGGVFGLVKAALIIVVLINITYHLMVAVSDKSDMGTNNSFLSPAAVTLSTTYSVASTSGLIF